jgi:hypothetical protein
MIEFFKENNVFHITPSARFFYDMKFNNVLSFFYLEFAWFNWTLSIKLIK